MVTLNEVREALDKFNQRKIEWEKRSGVIDDSFVEWAYELTEWTGHQEFEPAAWDAILCVDDFLIAYQEWATEAERPEGHVSPQGSATMWAKWDAIFSWGLKTPKYAARIEPVPSLLAQGLTYEMVAKMYGWRDANGNWDGAKVAEEVARPGTHTKDWKNPLQVAHDERTAKRWTEREDTLIELEAKAAAREEAPPVEPGPAPERIEELLMLDGITVEQIQRMKKCSVEEIREAAVRIGKTIDAETAIMLAGRGEIDEAQRRMDRHLTNRVGGMDTLPDLPLTDRVWALDDQGYSVGEILKGLLTTVGDLTYRQVVSILAEKPQVNHGQEKDDTAQGAGEEDRQAESETEAEDSRKGRRRKRGGKSPSTEVAAENA